MEVVCNFDGLPDDVGGCWSILAKVKLCFVSALLNYY
jgi:hypothetical protein